MEDLKMSNYIALYYNNPTAGLKDGTIISDNGSFTSPLSVTLNATNNESKYVLCAVRTNSGYATVGNTVIDFEGAGKDKWSIAPDNENTEETIKSVEFKSSLTITDEIIDKNKLFWVKADSSDDEEPFNDKSVVLKVSCTIKAVE